jgi:gas vesicle protein
MQFNDRGGTRALTIGAVLGALVAGAAVGVLTAPESGAGTRRRLRRGIADISGPRLRDRWGDLSAGFERRRERHERDALVERLESRIDALEEHLEEAEVEAAELDDELEPEEAESAGHSGSALGLAAAALLTWFISSEKAAPARERAREAAGKARDRAGDEWQRFKQHRAGYRRTGDRIVPEGAAASGEPKFQ